MKAYPKTSLEDNQRRMNVIREVSIMQKARHGNIIELVEIFSDKTQLFLAMEFIGSCTMFDLLKQQ